MQLIDTNNQQAGTGGAQPFNPFPGQQGSSSGTWVDESQNFGPFPAAPVPQKSEVVLDPEQVRIPEAEWRVVWPLLKEAMNKPDIKIRGKFSAEDNYSDAGSKEKDYFRAMLWIVRANQPWYKLPEELWVGYRTHDTAYSHYHKTLKGNKILDAVIEGLNERQKESEDRTISQAGRLIGEIKSGLEKRSYEPRNLPDRTVTQSTATEARAHKRRKAGDGSGTGNNTAAAGPSETGSPDNQTGTSALGDFLSWQFPQESNDEREEKNKSDD